MKKKDIRKTEAISNATQKIVCEHGLDRASIANIAKEAHVSPATIYLHFVDKSDLLSKVFLKEKQYILDTITAALTREKSFYENLAAAHKVAFKYMWKNPISLRFTEILETTPYNPVQELNKKYGAFWTFCQSGIEQGVIEDISPDSIMMMFHAPLISAVLQFHSLYCSCDSCDVHDEDSHQLAEEYVGRVEQIQQDLFYLTWKALKKEKS